MERYEIRKGESKPVIEPGLYGATVTGCEVYEKKFAWGLGKGLRFYFKLDEGQETPNDFVVNGLFWLQKDDKGYYIKEGSVGHNWTKAILGHSPAGIVPKEYENKKCQIYIKLGEGKDGAQYAQVEDVLPIPGKKKNVKPNQQNTPEEDDENSNSSSSTNSDVDEDDF